MTELIMVAAIQMLGWSVLPDHFQKETVSI